MRNQKMQQCILGIVQKKSILNIGFDDTDSPNGMCTTYLAYKLVGSLKQDGVKFLDYPRLIRFNPNIPWKTRGNGAVSIRVQTDRPEEVKNKVIRFVSKYSDVKNGANPGVVFYQSDTIPRKFAEFSKNALWKLVSRSEARRFLKRNGLESYHIGNGQGLIGAIGAIGYDFDDHTFELLSYRTRPKFGTKRFVNGSSVRKMQERLARTFNSYDTKKNKVLLAPRGPDPVLYGVRGEDVRTILDASRMIRSEKPAGYLVFKSNQGTGDHLRYDLDVNDLRPYSSGKVTGVVSKKPQIQQGGHVMFCVVKDGVEVNCAVYRPTGITQQAMGLEVGDRVRVGGGIRRASKNHLRTLNVEFFEVLKLQKKTILVNPKCKNCRKNMKSKGREQGYECVRCGRKSRTKTSKTVPRNLKKGLYIPQPSAHRHLTRPQKRIGVKNLESEFDERISWFSVNRN
jgi:tRNA(Ile2)-agmatinylcytidine synthase